MTPLLSLQGITRRCPDGTLALDDVSFEVMPGEVVALVGENGAGKSSLMNVAFGLYRADAGRVLWEGREVHFGSPREALAAGLGMVHQHFMLVPPLTVAENVVLGREPTKHGLLDLQAAEADLAKHAQALGFALDPKAPTETLPVGTQQRVEIVKALARGARLLILDEPTAVLAPQEVEELFAIVRRLVAQGTSVVFIGHNLREVLSLADRVAVLARGKLVATLKAKETTPEQLTALMVTTTAASTAPGHPATQPPGELRVALQGASCRNDRGLPALHDVSLELRAGELVCIAGIAGNGQTELCELLTGLRPLEAGTLTVHGKRLDRPDPAALRALGMGHVPEDRHRRALAMELTLAENLSLGRQRQAPFARGLFIDRAGRSAEAQRLLALHDVRPPNPDKPAHELSGGNQQKLVIGRELSGSPSWVVAAQPTRGLDVGAIRQLHGHLLAARDRGAAVLVVSMDLEEVFTLADRILVMAHGRFVGEAKRGEATEAQLGAWMLGR